MNTILSFSSQNFRIEQIYLFPSQKTNKKNHFNKYTVHKLLHFRMMLVLRLLCLKREYIIVRGEFNFINCNIVHFLVC